jgi:TatD DNase family protein
VTHEERWVDTHCHLDHQGARFSADAANAQVHRASAAGVDWMVTVGTDLPSSQHALDLASRHPQVFAAVGLHPHDASTLGAQWGMLEALAQAEECVAVGESGFDLHYEHSPRDEQEVAFRFHIRLAKHLGKALVVHSREAWDDTFRVLAEEGTPEPTVFHCFTGGPDEARRALDLGAHLSFSGVVTFKTAEEVRAAARLAPADRILVETDSPYLAPVPFRGRPNEPALVGVVGAAVAAARDTDPRDVADRTRANAAAVFGVSW